jgi:hypothetical protein
VDGPVRTLHVEEHGARRQAVEDGAPPARSSQVRAAVATVNGLIGSRATSPASRSLKRSARIRKRRSDGGAPCGKRFRRSASWRYAPRAVAWAMAVPHRPGARSVPPAAGVAATVGASTNAAKGDSDGARPCRRSRTIPADGVPLDLGWAAPFGHAGTACDRRPARRQQRRHRLTGGSHYVRPSSPSRDASQARGRRADRGRGHPRARARLPGALRGHLADRPRGLLLLAPLAGRPVCALGLDAGGGVRLLAGVPAGDRGPQGTALGGLPGCLDGAPAAGRPLAGGPAPLGSRDRLHGDRAAGRQHPHPARRRDRRRLPYPAAWGSSS